MSYSEFVKEQLEKPDGFKRIVELLKNIKGKKCLVFFHDDPDGLTSGAIIYRILKKLGAEIIYRIPETMELEKHRIQSELRITNYELLIIVDKATMGYYNEYPDLIKDVVIIDHHPLVGEYPNKCLVFNPSIPQYTLSSAAILCNMVSQAMGLRDELDDFLTLIGLKGDWAIEPATDFVAPFVKPFYDDAIKKFPNLVKKISSRPTMFEVNQREKTTVLNQIAEFYFALSGGGFQYFYNDRIPELKNRRQVEFAFDTLLNLKAKDYSSPDDFIEQMLYIPTAKHIEQMLYKNIARKIYQCFLDDWNKSKNMFDNVALFNKLDGVNIYLFVGNNVALMPMVGSVKLYELGNPCVLVMFNWLGEKNGVHISFRANTDKIHCGNIATQLVEKLVSKFGHRGEISGGGHPKAAEFKTRSSGVSLYEIMKEFLIILGEE
ncbi:MAG: DHH family phosphoesterase [Elusimicrobiota bacterium]